MPRFRDLVTGKSVELSEILRPDRASGPALTGCQHCPLNKVEGVRKILGLDRIQGRRAMLWAQSPGRSENDQGLELVGPSGKLLWRILKGYGLKRSDFDIQNVLRCWPVSKVNGELVEHNPTKVELQCCSVYNGEALRRNGGRAVVHLVLGKTAAVTLLGNAFRKDTPIFWHDPWKAYVVYADHPAYILRLGGEAAGWKYREFVERLRAVRVILDHPGRWGYVKAQNYGAVVGKEELTKLEKLLRQESAAGRRISVDVEDAKIDGSRKILAVGFGWGRYHDGNWEGGARSALLDHPEAGLSAKDRGYALDFLKRLLEDHSVLKVLQHGVYDQRVLRECLGIRLRGYDVDSQYASYLRWSYRRTHSLDALAQSYFVEFADYKSLVVGYESMAEVPLDALVLYNCADADLTKRVETLCVEGTSLPLLRTYTKAACVLEEMEQRGPYLDMQEFERVHKTLPLVLERISNRLKILAENPDFNPNASAQVAWLLFDKLKLPDDGGRSTNADALQLLLTKTRHPAVELVLRYRKFQRMVSTYIRGYERSASLHGGQLRTRWNLTGTSTGRISSGGSGDGLVNFQNLHSDPLLQNLLVSDPEWRKVLEDGDDQ